MHNDENQTLHWLHDDHDEKALEGMFTWTCGYTYMFNTISTIKRTKFSYLATLLAEFAYLYMLFITTTVLAWWRYLSICKAGQGFLRKWDHLTEISIVQIIIENENMINWYI